MSDGVQPGHDPDGDEGPTDSQRLGIQESSGEMPSWQDSKDRVTYLLAEYKYILSIAGLAGFTVLASGFASIPSLPPKVTLVLKWFAVGIVPAVVIAKRTIVEWFVPDNRHRVLVLNPESGVEARDVAVPRRLWTTREHTDGRPALIPSRGNIDAVVRTFDYVESEDKIVVEGVNREIANPVDATVVDGRISQIYDSLLDAREELRDLRATMDARIQQIQEANLNSLMAAWQESIAVNPEDARDMVREPSNSDPSRPLSADALDDDRRDLDRDDDDDDDDHDGNGRVDELLEDDDRVGDEVDRIEVGLDDEIADVIEDDNLPVATDGGDDNAE